MPNAAALRTMIASLLLLTTGLVNAAVISVGTPTTNVPASLVDPLGSLSSPLPADRFLLPIEVTGANGLQDWIFDLLFDDSVVTPVDAGGLYQSVYQAEFSAADPTESNITSSGFPGLPPPGSLEGIAGFSSGVSGNGLLAFVLFDYLPGQQGEDPAFRTANARVQQAPEPATIVLFGAALLAAGLLRGRRGRIVAAPR